MDEDFINQYVQRILREVDHINRDRLLKETKIIILESHNEVNKNEIENLKTQILIADELKNQALSSLEKITIDYKNLQENKNALESTIRDLNNENNRVDILDKELRSLESTIRDLNNEKTNLNQELNSEKNRAANLDREIRSLEKNAEKNIQENKNALESTIRDLNNEKTNLNQELNNEKNRAANLDREIARQSGELNAMFLELKNLQENKNALESTIRDLNNEKIELNQELAKQSDEHNDMLLELQNSTQQVVDTTVTTTKNNRRPRTKVSHDNTF